jgi:hypothetical protein
MTRPDRLRWPMIGGGHRMGWWAAGIGGPGRDRSFRMPGKRECWPRFEADLQDAKMFRCWGRVVSERSQTGMGRKRGSSRRSVVCPDRFVRSAVTCERLESLPPAKHVSRVLASRRSRLRGPSHSLRVTGCFHGTCDTSIWTLDSGLCDGGDCIAVNNLAISL